MAGTVANYDFHNQTSVYVARTSSMMIPMIKKSESDLFNLIAYRFIDGPTEVTRFIDQILMFYNIDHLTWIPRASAVAQPGVRTELALYSQAFINDFNSKGANELCTELLDTKVRGSINELIPIIQSSLILSINKCLKNVISDSEFYFSDTDQNFAKELYNALKRAMNIKYGSVENKKEE